MHGMALVAAMVIARTVWVYFSQRAAGVGGNDPNTYVQMALDIVHSGSPIHDFPLTRLAARPPDAERGWYERGFMTAGYTSRGADSNAVPLFPAGLPWLLAIGLRLGGETGLFLVPPLLGVLGLLATWLVAVRLASGIGLPRPYEVGILAAGILALSWRQTLYALAPSSDLGAQAFMMLAIAAALEARERAGLRWPLLTGLAIAAAYHVRHPSVLVVAVCGVVMLAGRPREGRAWARLAVALVTLAIAALPDLAFHLRHYGSVLGLEDPGGRDFAWQKFLSSSWASLREVGASREFGPLLIVVAIVGASLLRTRSWKPLAVVGLWPALFFLFHMPLRLTALFDNAARFVEPAFPGLAIGAALGIAAAVSTTRRLSVPGLATLGALAWFGTVKAPLMYATRDYRPYTYGLLTPSQRHTFEALGKVLPEGAIVITDPQNLGAVHMYAKRWTVVPWWRRPQWFAALVGQAQREGWSIFALGDLPALANQGEPGYAAYLLDYQWTPVHDEEVAPLGPLQRLQPRTR